MKKVLLFVLSTVLVLCLVVSLLINGEITPDVQAATSGDYTYTVNGDGEATITDFPSYYFHGSLTIPSTLGGYRVTCIGANAFDGCRGLTSVVIPDSVTSIGAYAFDGCYDLTSVTIGNSVTSIGSSAFYGCNGLTSVTLPDSVTNIGSWAFWRCTGLTSIVIPDSVTSIGAYAFDGCAGLTSVTIGNSVTSIGAAAFEGCRGLTSVTIPDSVTSIGAYAFEGCTGLTSVTIPDSVTSIGANAFYGCTGLTSVYVTDIAAWCDISFDLGNTPLSYAKNLYLNGVLVTDLVIPDSVTSIGAYAFEGCTGLTSVTVPNSVTSIGKYAFSGCSGLTSVRFHSREAMSKCKSAFGSSVSFLCLCKDDQHLYTQYSDLTCEVCMFARAPLAPTIAQVTDNSITLTAVEGYEYKIDNFAWTTNPTFTGLNPITTYTFYQRVAETDTTYASESSGATIATTKKLTVAAPSAPTVAEKTDTTVTLVAVDGYEYKIGDGEWTTNPVFAGLYPATEYAFYQRVAETATTYASDASVSLVVVTNNPPYVPGDIDGVEGVTDADAEYLLMYTFFPEDYPVNQACDFNGDTFVNDADAEHLLMYTFFPEDYPLH